jgi:hypothetical protein
MSDGVSAETYEGVISVHSTVSRAAEHAQAIAAAHGPNPYADGAGSGTQTVASIIDRATVHAQAVTTAHDPLQSLDRRAFYRDKIPSQYFNSSITLHRQAIR